MGEGHDLDHWPTDLNFNRDYLLIKNYLPTKFEASGAQHSWVICWTRETNWQAWAKQYAPTSSKGERGGVLNILRLYSLQHMTRCLARETIFKVCRQSQKTFLFLFCFFIIFLLLLRSAWRSQQTFLFLFCFFLFFYYSFLFFSTATCVLQFLRQFSTNLDEIWHVDSPWWDEQTEYFFKSIGPGVGTGRGAKVLLCFIIGKTLYTLRRDKNFT